MASKPRAPVKKSLAKPTFFAEPDQFRAWLAKHHATAPELLVGFYKRDSGKPSITWPESVDQALCFGWIDGVRKRVDDVSYTIRFTPRRAGSNWSSINIRRVGELDGLGHMQEAGLAAFAKRSDEKSRIYVYEQRHTPASTLNTRRSWKGTGRPGFFPSSTTRVPAAHDLQGSKRQEGGDSGETAPKAY